MTNTKNRILKSSMLWAFALAALGGTPGAIGQSSTSAVAKPSQHDSSHANVPAEAVQAQAPEQASMQNAVDIVRDPADVPPPVGKRQPQIVRVSLIAQELEGKLDAVLDATYEYWTFNGKVPGPMIRVRQGDTVELTLKNDGRLVSHSIDLHAALGPGGGMDLTEAKLGESRTFTFKAIVPGVFVYHCGTNLAAQHIANGMYGLIVVEPPEGLPRVDHEFYVMQGEIYTVEDIGGTGHQKMSLAKLMDERPEYIVFNGAVGALSSQHPNECKGW
jgi:nitrite reductase (NO-forming)